MRNSFVFNLRRFSKEIPTLANFALIFISVILAQFVLPKKENFTQGEK